MLSFIISTVIFLVASFFLNRYFEEWGLDKGKARTLLVLAIASAISYGGMIFVDHLSDNTDSHNLNQHLGQ